MTLPILVPVTRREPPIGHRQPDYKALEFIGDSLAPVEYSNDDDRLRVAMAKEAVRKALAGPATRWWGFTMLLIRFRLFLQGRRKSQKYT